ncbi:MAG: sulfite exporter TauE/SafE family protein [Methanomicrobiales archaeon]|nr:sulfite exporter TauE/SafE family protein [Methanomicrobiales archaeon]
MAWLLMAAAGMDVISGFEIMLIGLVAVLAGLINALAGGGTLILFPTLIALGIPPVSANVTHTVALTAGYLGGALGQRRDLRGQGKRLWMFLPAGAVGGLIGGYILLRTGQGVFRVLVPFLILFASGILAVQDRVRGWIAARTKQAGGAPGERTEAIIPVGLASVYGGFFGAGVSVMVLAVLALFMDETITRLNALKQAISLAISVTAAAFFLFSGMVVWSLVPVMAAGAIAGGVLGGRLASVIHPVTLRWTVVGAGLIIGTYFLAELFLVSP